MRIASLSTIIVACFLSIVFYSGPAEAQLVFVAQTGSDGNPCTFAQPCRTFQRAHDSVPDKVLIDVLDPGDYGPININRGTAIFGHGLAQIIVPDGNVGINIPVNITPGAIVTVDGVIITGMGTTAGFAVNAGFIKIKNSIVRSVGTGIVVYNAKVDLINTDIVDSTRAIKTIGQGADQGAPAPFTLMTSGTTFVRIAGGNALSHGGSNAFQMQDPGMATGGCNRVSIWMFTDATNWSMNVAGWDQVLSVTGTGSGSPCGLIQQYSNGNAPL